MRPSLIAMLLLLSASAGTARADQADPLIGWWRATLSHAGESDDIYLHFAARKEGIAVSMALPTIGALDTPLGRAKSSSDSVELSDVGWTLKRVGDELVGTTPQSLVPAYQLAARFERAAAPSVAQVTPERASPEPIWRRNVRGPVFAGLTFDRPRKRLVVATDTGWVLALNPADGRVAWSYDAGGPIRATPTAAANAIYVPTDGALMKLDAASGRLLWSSSLGKQKTNRLEISDPKSRWDHYSSSAVVTGQAVYVGSRDGCVYRFSVASGSKLGRYCATDLITATPVIDGKRLYFASFDQNVYSADIGSGKILWKRDMGGAVPRDLALAGPRILVGSRSYDLTALDRDSGKPVWNRYYWFSWVDSSPNLVGNIVYIGASDALRVFAFDGASGGKLWESRVPGWTWAKPAVGRSTIYASVAGTATSYVGPRAGGFAAIDRQSGKLRWFMSSEKPDKAPVYGFAAAPLVENGMVYTADLAGNVFAFRDQQ